MEEALPMTTATLERIAKSRQYSELCRRFPPRVIRNKGALAEAHQVIERLMQLGDKLTRDQAEYLELLASLAERFESETLPTPSATAGEMLGHLIEAKGTTRAQVARDTKIPRSTITQVIQGERNLSSGNILRLAQYFSVPTDVLLKEPLS
jgi:antitoxin component HigA of HigAB toxin-antitoxin module